jgi:hypothetical protein
MTDLDVIERLDALWPSPTGPYECERTGKNLYAWHVGARDRVKGFLIGIMPWLGERRRARAEAALELLARNRGINTDTCARGHDMTGDNRGFKSGRRYCRRCQRDRERDRVRSR